MKERKTLEQLAAEAHETHTNGIKCPRCGCADFRIDKTKSGETSKFRWKECRHCGHKIVTRTQEIEHIVRDVSRHQKPEDEDEQPILRLA